MNAELLATLDAVLDQGDCDPAAVAQLEQALAGDSAAAQHLRAHLFQHRLMLEWAAESRADAVAEAIRQRLAAVQLGAAPAQSAAAGPNRGVSRSSRRKPRAGLRNGRRRAPSTTAPWIGVGVGLVAVIIVVLALVLRPSQNSPASLADTDTTQGAGTTAAGTVFVSADSALELNHWLPLRITLAAHSRLTVNHGSTLHFQLEHGRLSYHSEAESSERVLISLGEGHIRPIGTTLDCQYLDQRSSIVRILHGAAEIQGKQQTLRVHAGTEVAIVDGNPLPPLVSIAGQPWAPGTQPGNQAPVLLSVELAQVPTQGPFSLQRDATSPSGWLLTTTRDDPEGGESFAVARHGAALPLTALSGHQQWTVEMLVRSGRDPRLGVSLFLGDGNTFETTGVVTKLQFDQLKGAPDYVWIPSTFKRQTILEIANPQGTLILYGYQKDTAISAILLRPVNKAPRNP